MGEATLDTSSFPWFGNDVEPYAGPYLDNVRALLLNHAVPVPGLGVPKVVAWTATLRCNEYTVRLHIYEEQINERKSVFCDSCRIIGEECQLEELLSPALRDQANGYIGFSG